VYRLSKLTGIPQCTLSRIESGAHREPRLGTIKKLVDASGGELPMSIWSAQ